MTDNNPAQSSKSATAQATQSAAVATIAPNAQMSSPESRNYGAATEKKIKEVIDACERYGNKAIVALAGVPGTGKSFIALIAAQRFANEPTLVREIQFHQSFSY